MPDHLFQTHLRGVEATSHNAVPSCSRGSRRTLVGLKPQLREMAQSITDGFRRTLVGLKLGKLRKRGYLQQLFQTNPRGVEARC